MWPTHQGNLFSTVSKLFVFIRHRFYKLHLLLPWKVKYYEVEYSKATISQLDHCQYRLMCDLSWSRSWSQRGSIFFGIVHPANCHWVVLVSDANGLIEPNLGLTFLQRVRFVFVQAFELSFIEHSSRLHVWVDQLWSHASFAELLILLPWDTHQLDYSHFLKVVRLKPR